MHERYFRSKYKSELIGLSTDLNVYKFYLIEDRSRRSALDPRIIYTYIYIWIDDWLENGKRSEYTYVILFR